MSNLVRRKIQTEAGFSGNIATQYGKLHEADALAEYLEFRQQTEPQLSVQASGLVISLSTPYLACS